VQTEECKASRPSWQFDCSYSGDNTTLYWSQRLLDHEGNGCTVARDEMSSDALPKRDRCGQSPIAVTVTAFTLRMMPSPFQNPFSEFH
jgi:hypothetical protein